MMGEMVSWQVRMSVGSSKSSIARSQQVVHGACVQSGLPGDRRTERPQKVT